MTARTRLVGLLAVGVVLLLLSGVVFASIVIRLREAQDSVREDAVWAVYQLDRETLRLDASLRALADQPSPDRQTAVSRTYDILFSRVSLLETGTFPNVFGAASPFGVLNRSIAVSVRSMAPALTRSPKAGPIGPL